MTLETVLVLGGYDRSLVAFRASLLAAVRISGRRVVAAAPRENPEVADALANLGVEYCEVSLRRTGTNPYHDLLAFVACIRAVRAVRPQVFLGYTLKPVAFGCLAAWLCGVPRIYSLITGLGAAFFTPGWRGFLLRQVVSEFYRVALRKCTRVLVQNREIARLLVERNLVDSAEKILVVPGSGVDLRHFACRPFPGGAPRFLFLGRFLRDKGVRELVAAARIVRRAMPEVAVVMAGGLDSNASSVSAEELEAWRIEGVVEIMSFVPDVRADLAASWALVLPSYHEGLPRSVLEAMAVGRAVITTDTIGCRDTIEEPGTTDCMRVRWGRNGALVPVADSEALAAAMLHLARNPTVAAALGANGRVMAQQTFDVDHVNREMMIGMHMLSSAIDQVCPRVI